MGTRIEIFRDGLWRRLKLKNEKSVRYNVVINRIGKISSREISHTNTFSIPAVSQNTQALDLNFFNSEALSRTLNSKFQAKYYIEDKIIQQGFLIINNMINGVINVNFIDKSLEIVEKWGAITYNDLLISTSIEKPDDFAVSIVEMTDYSLNKTAILAPLSNVGARGYPLAIFPNNLNTIGDTFQKDSNGDRLPDLFNPYQSRPIFNAKAFIDISCESFGYTVDYDASVDWTVFKKTYIVNQGLDSNREGLGTGVVDNIRPVVLSNEAHYAIEIFPVDGFNPPIWTFHTVFTYPAGELYVTKPNAVTGWVNPIGFQSGYENKSCIYVPDISTSTGGTISFNASIEPNNEVNEPVKIYTIWENTTGGSDVLFKVLPTTINLSDAAKVEITIAKTELVIPPAGGGNLIGMIMQVEATSVDKTFSTLYLKNMQVIEGIVPALSTSYDEWGQYDANTVHLTHATPRETIKKIMSGLMEKEGILINIDSITKTIKLFSYGRYETEKNLGNYSDWSSYFLKTQSRNTDYGNNYARKNRLGLKSPYLGNEFILSLTNQGADSKYKDSINSYNNLFTDVSGVFNIANPTTPYFEYKNTGLGLVEEVTALGQLTQSRAEYLDKSAGSFVVTRDYIIKEIGTTDFTLIGATSNTVGLTFTATGAGSGTGIATEADNTQGTFTGLRALSNVNYGTLPSGAIEWYRLIDKAIRVEALFLIPVDIIKTFDITIPVFIKDLGGFFIVEEISEYVNAQTQVVVKLIKLIDNLKA